MAAARTWRWVPAFLIRPSVPSSSRDRLRGIVAENPMRSVPNQSLAACITNTPSQLPALDRFFADHNTVTGFSTRRSPLDQQFAVHRGVSSAAVAGDLGIGANVDIVLISSVGASAFIIRAVTLS